jgi:hypothetical protein
MCRVVITFKNILVRYNHAASWDADQSVISISNALVNRVFALEDESTPKQLFLHRLGDRNWDPRQACKNA